MDESPNSPQLAKLIQQHDWTDFPAGSQEVWAGALRNAVDLTLGTKFPMLLMWGQDLRSIYNDAFVDILGDRHPQALGLPASTVWADIWDQIRPILELALAGKASYFEDMLVPMMRHGALQNTYFTFSYSPLFDDARSVAGVMCICQETTKSVLARKSLLTKNDQFQQLFSQAPGFMAVMRGPTHIIELGNDAYSTLIGHRDVFGKTVAEALPEAGEQGFVDLLDQVYRTGVAYVGRATQYTVSRSPDQPPSQIYIDFVYQPIFDTDGHVTGIMLQGHEVTDAYLAREALLAADRQKDQFIATLAHELRNPLSPIRAASQILQLPNLTPVTLEKTIPVIGRQVEHMAKLLDDLLDVARISRNQIRLNKEKLAVDMVVAMAVETAKPLIDHKKQKIIIQHHDVIELYADRVRLTQVVTNLIRNASKYNDIGGTIIVDTRDEEGQCRIAVKDTGIGLKREALTTVFHMFAQERDGIERSEGGLGIGLGLVKGLVELHDGSVRAESDGLGKGSTFIVSIPCVARHHQQDSTSPDNESAAVAPPMKILIADDNVDLVDTLASFLEMMGHQVTSATNGIQAFELAKQQRPDIAIVDIGMPGMTGYELAQAIRKEAWGSSMPLIAATGWGNESDQVLAKAAGFTAHLTKPYAMDKLSAVLYQISR